MENQVSLPFQINPSSGTPIYKQIIEQVNRLVISGFLKAGDELPSVRQVAEKLEVNPMTISKAYSMLEATGVLERIRGKGMIISEQKKDKSLDKRLELLRPILFEAAAQANQLSIPKEVILKTFKDILEGTNE
ncbi:GntR family transcriptional regulator [candidate division KSB1 bacterium]